MRLPANSARIFSGNAGISLKNREVVGRHSASTTGWKRHWHCNCLDALSRSLTRHRDLCDPDDGRSTRGCLTHHLDQCDGIDRRNESGVNRWQSDLRSPRFRMANTCSVSRPPFRFQSSALPTGVIRSEVRHHAHHSRSSRI